MNEKAIRILEYDRILEQLAALATSQEGANRCRALRPFSDLYEIRQRQRQTTDACSRIFRKGSPSFGNVRDIRPMLLRLRVGGILHAEELLTIAALLENAGRIKAYGRSDSADAEEDSLDSFFALLEPVHPLSSEIRRCIPAPDEISDDASPGLRQVRRSIRIAGDRIHSQLNGMINGSLRSCLQDAVITLRDGRYCLPVKAEYRSSVPGMVHDQSSTGATLFIEPMTVVRLNNEIRELRAREAEEIEAVLAELSSRAALSSESLELDLENMAELDFIFARAKLSLDMKASEPVFNTDRRIRLRQARHPLIDRKAVVPIDVELGDTYDLLIITGPNTGGKTVTLKTTGLLALMGQSGLHIPAGDRSELAVFPEVYADIGDEQSIEQSLSTFSSHMTNIVSFLEEAATDSLVLFDELGAGTDPVEGAALAVAILSFLHRQGIRTMATTHYSELKAFALSTPGVQNASCEFDVATLRPTYRLLIGIPGKSNAFAISEKLGLPSYIIDEAREQISEQDESFEDILSSLEQSRRELESRDETSARREAELAEREKKLEESVRRLEEQREKIIRKANEDARLVLQEAKDYADQTMKDFRRFGKEGISSSEMERRRTALREKLSDAQQKTALRTPETGGRKPAPGQLHLGDSVRILSMNLNGTVSSLPDAKGNLFVQCGIIRSKVNISDLELIDEEVISTPALKKTGTGRLKMSKSYSVSSEINLLGKTVDEAVAELDKYLDDAYLAHLSSVRVIHGKGTGALRKGIHNYLRRHRHVSEFHLGEFGEGDAGVTIVKLKK